jgi:protein associated with RNAse G/E
MKKIRVGDRYQIQCYKHNGKIHRAWDEAIVLDVKDDYIVFGNNRTQVIEASGNYWHTREPAVMYFFKDKWFNIIAQIKRDGIYYYCNIASPAAIEEKTIKYIDYDLDLRIFPSGEYKILDRLEYKYHKKIMEYPNDLDHVINNSLSKLIESYVNGAIYFSNYRNLEYSKVYSSLVGQNSEN